MKNITVMTPEKYEAIVKKVRRNPHDAYYIGIDLDCVITNYPNGCENAYIPTAPSSPTEIYSTLQHIKFGTQNGDTTDTEQGSINT